ncbi:hypothetical protein GOP47_0014568 [Adiantum capillus-veneris]|uniref:Uncharacterized protein n=1 Tax=Adiantum capillus-veneris TaxID=13818 RepID=A0A9D4ZEA8_ADICA|nr:hypothetical protein GOP47_0014568 [Adiantum capillus-veneris]
MALSRPVTLALLILNSMLYLIIMALAGWLVSAIVDPDIDFLNTVSRSGETLYLMTLSLISGAAGLGSSVCGFHLLHSSSTGSYNACLGVGLVAAILTLEILGLSSKAIHVGLFRSSLVKSLESLSIIASSTQIFYVISLIVGKKFGDFP